MPKGDHDRVIQVRLTSDGVQVDYQLEVDPYTAVFLDIPAVLAEDELSKLTKPEQFYETFLRAYAPILAANLRGKSDGDELQFACTHKSFQVLDHLRCTFVFHAKWPGSRHGRRAFQFYEGNYELESGTIRLSLSASSPLTVYDKVEPDETLKARSAMDLRPGDLAKLRNVSATVFAPTPWASLPRPETKNGETRSTNVVSGKEEVNTSPAFAVAAMVLLSGVWLVRRRLRIASTTRDNSSRARKPS